MKNLYIVFLVLLSASCFHIQAQGSVGIGTASPNSSAILDVTSTTQGVLIPRMTTAQRDLINTPAAGLSIYNTTTNCIQVYNGTSWVSASCKCTAAPFVSAISGPTVVGYNQANVSYAVYGDPSATYTWSIDGNATITSSSSGIGLNAITVTPTGTLGVTSKFQIKLTVTNECGSTAAQPLLVASGGSITYTSPGTYNFNTYDISTITVSLWGAGGGSGYYCCSNNIGQGGTGAYLKGTIAPISNETLILKVGTGGSTNSGCSSAGCGGGGTEVLRNTTILCAAGGGGGGTYASASQIGKGGGKTGSGTATTSKGVDGNTCGSCSYTAAGGLMTTSGLASIITNTAGNDGNTANANTAGFAPPGSADPYYVSPAGFNCSKNSGAKGGDGQISIYW